MLEIHPKFAHRAAVLSAVATALFFAAIALGSPGADSLTSRGDRFLRGEHSPCSGEIVYTCHGGPGQGKGGWTRQQGPVADGGSSGPPIDLGSENSLLLAAIRYEGPSMPPSASCPAETIADFFRWIKMVLPIRATTRPRTRWWPPRSTSRKSRKAWAYTARQGRRSTEVREAGWPRGASTASSSPDRRQPVSGLDPTPRLKCGSVALRSTW